MSAYRLDNPMAFWALIPVLLLLWSRLRAHRRRPTLVIPSVAPLTQLPRGIRSYFSWLPPVLGALGLVFLVVALARPQERKAQARDVAVEGIDIVVSFDLSTSMRAVDFKPKDRFHVAKEVLKEFVASRPMDRLGLVVFAADAFTQCPLTLDHAVLLNIIDSLRLGVIEDGTAIGNGIATAVNRLRESDAKSRVVILVTDGDNNAGNISPMEAAEMARSLGIKVFTILVGKGGLTPYPREDVFGRTRYVQLDIPVNPELLDDIAKHTGGQYYQATDRESLSKSLQNILDSLEKTRIFEAGAFAQHEELFFWWLWPGLALALLDLLLSATVLRRFP